MSYLDVAIAAALVTGPAAPTLAQGRTSNATPATPPATPAPEAETGTETGAPKLVQYATL